jgi:excisionase family DNA binding protein
MSNRDDDFVGLLTTNQVAKVLCVSERTIFSLTRSGQLPAIRFGRSVRYAQEDINGFILRSRHADNMCPEKMNDHGEKH